MAIFFLISQDINGHISFKKHSSFLLQCLFPPICFFLFYILVSIFHIGDVPRMSSNPWLLSFSQERGTKKRLAGSERHMLNGTSQQGNMARLPSWGPPLSLG